MTIANQSENIVLLLRRSNTLMTDQIRRLVRAADLLLKLDSFNHSIL